MTRWDRLWVILCILAFTAGLMARPAVAEESPESRARFPLTVQGTTLSRAQFHELLTHNNRRLKALEPELARQVGFTADYTNLRLSARTSPAELMQIATRALELDRILDLVLSLKNFRIPKTSIASALRAHRQADRAQVDSLLADWRAQLARIEPAQSPAATAPAGLDAETAIDRAAYDEVVARARDYEGYFGIALSLLLGLLCYSGWQAHRLHKLTNDYQRLKKSARGPVAIPVSRPVGTEPTSRVVGDVAKERAEVERLSRVVTHLEQVNQARQSEIDRLRSLDTSQQALIQRLESELKTLRQPKTESGEQKVGETPLTGDSASPADPPAVTNGGPNRSRQLNELTDWL